MWSSPSPTALFALSNSASTPYAAVLLIIIGVRVFSRAKVFRPRLWPGATLRQHAFEQESDSPVSSACSQCCCSGKGELLSINKGGHLYRAHSLVFVAAARSAAATQFCVPRIVPTHRIYPTNPQSLSPTLAFAVETATLAVYIGAHIRGARDSTHE